MLRSSTIQLEILWYLQAHLQKDVKAELEKTNDVDAAAYLGKVIAEQCTGKGHQGQLSLTEAASSIRVRVKALAEAAREAGLEF